MNRHHLLFTRHSWNSSPQTQKLRQQPSLIVGLEHTVHEEIHRRIPTIPLLDPISASKVNYAPHGKNPVVNIEELMKAVGEATVGQSEIALRLGKLVIYTLEIQRDFIKGSYYED